MRYFSLSVSNTVSYMADLNRLPSTSAMVMYSNFPFCSVVSPGKRHLMIFPA